MDRDMTKKQFDNACEKHGFVPQGFLGFYSVGNDSDYQVSIYNAGSRRRDQLAYLIKHSNGRQHSTWTQ